MTTPAEAVKAGRPVEPPRSGQFLVVALVTSGLFALAGATVGDVGWLWGLISGAGSAALLYRPLRLTPSSVTAMVVFPTIGLWWFDRVVDGRDGTIDLWLSLSSGLGWLLVGLAFGYVVWQARRPSVRPGVIAAVGLAWFGAAAAAVDWATAIGYVDRLRRVELQAGQLEVITGAFHGWVGLLVALVGVGVAVAFHVGTPALGVIGGTVLVSLFAFNQIEFSPVELFTQVKQIGVLAQDFWPPDWTWPKTIGTEETFVLLSPMIETIRIAVIGATFGCLLALPLAFLASRPTSPNAAVTGIFKSILAVVRTIPDLFWAAVFAASVGFGPFAGALAMFMFSLVIMAKLLSETVDNIEVGPLEAADAAGASHWQKVAYGAFPQVFPNYVAYALYIFELNIRASVVIGIVGAGGIGRLLDERRSFFQWDQVMAIVLVIFSTVIIIEIVSIYVRRKLV